MNGPDTKIRTSLLNLAASLNYLMPRVSRGTGVEHEHPVDFSTSHGAMAKLSAALHVLKAWKGDEHPSSGSCISNCQIWALADRISPKNPLKSTGPRCSTGAGTGWCSASQYTLVPGRGIALRWHSSQHKWYTSNCTFAIIMFVVYRITLCIKLY